MDSIILTGPQGTSIQVGTWLRAYDTPDYGAKDLIKPSISENPFSEGGVLAFEDVGPRHMAIPLLVGSGAWGSLTQVESLLRLCARPGGVVDLQPDSEAQAVRFDVISGRWEEEYSTPENRALRRKGTLHLDCMPYGYLPTWILLASTASVALPGVIDLSGASVIGDVPGLVQMVVQPTAPTNYSAGSWAPDGVLWSFAGLPSSVAWWPATYLQGAGAGIPATTASYGFAPGGQVYRLNLAPSLGATWMELGAVQVAPGRAYKGRWRVFTLAAVSPSMSIPFMMSADAAVDNFVPMASAGPQATLPPNTLAGALTAPSAGFALLDLGAVTTPSVASGADFYNVRLWGAWPTYYPSGVGTVAQVNIAGVYMLPLEGPNGVLPRGLYPNLVKGGDSAQGWHSGFVADSLARTLLAADNPMSATNMLIRGNMLAHHRGGFPYISPTTMRLDVFGGARLTRLTYPGALQQIPGLSRYWRFSEPLGASMARAAAGALDLTHRGGVITGASGGVSGDADGAVRYDGASAYSSATPNSGVDILQEYVFSCIFNIATIGSTGDTKIMFSTTSSPSPCGFQAYTLGQTLAAAVGNGASFIGLLSGGVVNASEWHHMVVSVSGTGATLYLDGVAVGGASYALATPIFSDNGHGEIAGAQRAGTSISTLFGGVLDDVAVHAPRTAGAHVPSFPQIQQLYHAARSGINATDSPLFHVTPQSAAVSVAYRPRFAFLKGL